MSADLYKDVIQQFVDSRNQTLALPMARYMRFQFEFLGLPGPARNRLQKGFLQAARREKIINWEFVYECWQKAEREYQYLAIDYLLVLNKILRTEDMARLEYLITARSWWDSVDVIAARLVAGLCSRYPQLIQENILKWSQADSIWLRRSAILFQLKYKQNTDVGLLAQIIEQNCDSKEFFINKAIGWSLREYSKTDPGWVRDFIADHHLHPLSTREGSKYL